jgi:hypothetical protein
MIRRGLIGLGTARVENWPQNLRSELLELQDLYARRAPEVRQLNPAEATADIVEEVEEMEGVEEVEAPRPPKTPKNKASRDITEAGPSVPAHKQQHDWILGPSHTALDAIERYQLVF